MAMNANMIPSVRLLSRAMGMESARDRVRVQDQDRTAGAAVEAVVLDTRDLHRDDLVLDDLDQAAGAMMDMDLDQCLLTVMDMRVSTIQNVQLVSCAMDMVSVKDRDRIVEVEVEAIDLDLLHDDRVPDDLHRDDLDRVLAAETMTVTD